MSPPTPQMRDHRRRGAIVGMVFGALLAPPLIPPLASPTDVVGNNGDVVSYGVSDMTTSIVAAAAFVAVVALFVLFSYWVFRQIRNGRIDPRMDPRWSPYSSPASPHSLIDPSTNFGPRPEYDDDHVRYLDE
jgi:hypothetical protein